MLALAALFATGGSLLHGGNLPRGDDTRAGTVAAAQEWKPIGKVAFVGNSITHHAPSERLNWQGNWGMAASSESSDYVHRLLGLIAERQPVAGAPQYEVFAQGGGRMKGVLQNRERLSRLHGDLIIIQMGENDRHETEAEFVADYLALIAAVRAANPEAKIVCTGVWSPGAGRHVKNDWIRQACAHSGIAFADVSAVAAVPANRASNVAAGLHAGVGWHPSDGGMEGYARSIMAAIDAGQAAVPVSSVRGASAQETFSIIFSQRFDRGSQLKGWTDPAAKDRRGGAAEISGGALQIRQSVAGGSLVLRHSLPLDRSVLGHELTVRARLCATNLSTPPQRWNGIKLVLIVVDAEAVRDYPQARIGSRIADGEWHEVSFTHLVPDNTIELTLGLGLENVTGELSVESIEVTARPVHVL